jgi:Glucosidase II beta subunit-like protein.
VKQKDKGKPYFTITDATGREFACRVYEEDELTPESMSESVFDVPVEKTSSIVRGRDHTLDSTVFEKDPNEIIGEEGIDGPTFSQPVEGAENVDATSKETIHEDKSKHDHVEFVYTTNIDEYLESQQGASKVLSSIPDDVRIDEKVLIESLNSLEGMCAQLHMGWWSYEWCYNDKVTQFHVQVQANQIKDVVSVKDLMPEFVVQSVSTIGTFTKRKIIVETTLQEQVSKEGGNIDDYDNDDDDEENSGNEAQKDQDTIPLETEKDVEKTQLDYTTDVLVIESYENGDYCEEAGANRVAEVNLRCCSNEDIISSFRQAGVTIHNPEMFSKPFESIDAPRAVLLDVIETSVCNYTMSVCTNVLCDSWVDNTMKEMEEEVDASAASNRVAAFENDVSIRYILEKHWQIAV